MKTEDKIDQEFVKQLLEKEDWSGVDLSGRKLVKLDLSGKNFSKCDLTGTNFLMCNLVGCDFTSSKLDGTEFTGANLLYAHFGGAKRNGFQVMKYASIVVGDDCVYAFLVRNGKGKKVMINEPNKKEYEFSRSTAKTETAMLYNLLMHEKA